MKRRKSINGIKTIAFASVGVFLILIGLSIFQIWQFKKMAEDAAPIIYQGFREFKETGETESFNKVKMALANLKSSLPFFSKFIPKIKTAAEITEELNYLSEALETAEKQINYLKNNAFNWAMNQRGQELISALEKLRMDIKAILDTVANIKNHALELSYPLDNDFIDIRATLHKSLQILDALIIWLRQPTPQNVLALFQNPSEMRPAGGFVGSYAEIIVQQGNLTDIEVSDIYDPDGQLDLKIIPPKPLQLITAGWGARDANWFFDFPTSARKIIEFLEASKIYSEQSINFSAIIAININVLEGLLEATGPIELPEYGVTIDGKNFLSKIQYEVEAGENKKAGEPKKILKVLAPLILERLAALSDERKQTLAENLRKYANRKDIMVYAENKILESYIQDLGMGGEIVNLPRNSAGEYLAVINANIGGGKSDAFIRQTVRLVSEIDLNGKIDNRLTIERSHNGKEQKDWWYRAANKNFIQIFLPIGAILTEVEGNNRKTVKPPIDYAARGYQEDPDLSAIEKSARFLEGLGVEETRQFGKTVFGAWFDIKAGETKKLKLRYVNPRKLNLSGFTQYRFVFEKQSGVQGGLEFSITAPPGYKWRENDRQTFSYSNNNLPARLILNLTLLPVLSNIR